MEEQIWGPHKLLLWLEVWLCFKMSGPQFVFTPNLNSPRDGGVLLQITVSPKETLSL
jgi:hypothetical protein